MKILSHLRCITYYVNFEHIYQLAIIFLSVLLYSSSLSADQVKNIRYYRISDDRIVIYYDLDCMETSAISVEVSLDSGNGCKIIPAGLSGDVGNAVSAGKYKRIVWEIYKDIDRLPDDFSIRVLMINSTQLSPLTLEEDKKVITAYPINSHIKLDGLFDEPSWKNAAPATDFTQRELVEGALATEKTEVKILYDNENLYIGVMCFDKEPDEIIHDELRRDGELRGVRS